MSETYFDLKMKLEELGYNNNFPIEAVPLVECLLADLVQTTRSLKHYMTLAKETIKQRDSLLLEVEPYRNDNARLIQENNRLHRESIELKEENIKLKKESKRKMKSLTDELMKKDNMISKLQHDVRDMSLRSLCAETLSSRNKSRRKDAGDNTTSKQCLCSEKRGPDGDFVELTKKLEALDEKLEEVCDENNLLRSQVDNRDSEIVRLNMLLEGGRPLTNINRENNTYADNRVQDLKKIVLDLEASNELLKKEIDAGLQKQHEAMFRALSLADKNKCLEDELKKVEELALKVEDDCNKRLAEVTNQMKDLQKSVATLTTEKIELEKELSNHVDCLSLQYKLKESQSELNIAIEKNKSLHKEISDLKQLNRRLLDKATLTDMDLNGKESIELTENVKRKCPSREEMHDILEKERKKYEKQISKVQYQLNETIEMFNKHMSNHRSKDISRNGSSSPPNDFIRELHNKLCECEQTILMLRKEKKELQSKIIKKDVDCNQNYKDIISQLNAENLELSKENILLSQQLSQYKVSRDMNNRGDHINNGNKVEQLQNEIGSSAKEIQILRKDKQEYISRYKEATELADKFKRDLAMKQKEIEHLQEENCSYKMTSRTGKASTDHLKDECNFLREQIKRMQTDVIKEKTLASQIRNIQLETERSSSEIQNELLCTQKKLDLSKDTIDTLEKKCKDLQSEIMSLKNEKSNLLENIRKMDQERDKLVIELDNKTETVSVLENKLKAQRYDINSLEGEIVDLKRKLNISKINDHKIVDFEQQILFLNSELSRLTQQNDTVIMENKRLQNSLGDANGTLKITKIELEKSKKEVEGLKQQLQHYVAEVRRIEELLSQKEAERSDMLEQFASLSVEANILENTNHSLESASASKTAQLQSYISKIQELESEVSEKENIIDSQTSRISSLTCKVTTLENEIKLISEEKSILEQNLTYLKQMCNNLQKGDRGTGDIDTDAKLFEDRIKTLNNTKAKLEMEKHEMREALSTTNTLLSNARREIIDLKLALQDATSETQLLQERVGRLTRRENKNLEMTDQDLELPLMLDEAVHEVSQEEDEEILRIHEMQRRYTKYTHGSTL